jgi:DnaJ-class molecular chaperone
VPDPDGGACPESDPSEPLDCDTQDDQKTSAADATPPTSTAAHTTAGSVAEELPGASAPDEECGYCGGSGQVSGSYQPVEGLASMDWEADCDECGGTGRVAL